MATKKADIIKSEKNAVSKEIKKSGFKSGPLFASSKAYNILKYSNQNKPGDKGSK